MQKASCDWLWTGLTLEMKELVNGSNTIKELKSVIATFNKAKDKRQA